MNQFYYKFNYNWTDLTFTSAIACKASYFLKKGFPAQWRDEGKLYNKKVGAHYSWCLTIDEMLLKLQNYSHQASYSYLADRKVLENAVKNKEYPFDKNRPFNIEVLDLEIQKEYFPKSIYENLEEFKYLIGE
jgi:hypothetical protein